MNILKLFKRHKEVDFDEFTKDAFSDTEYAAPHTNKTDSFQNFDPTPQSPGPAYGAYERNYSQQGGGSDLALIRKDLEIISAKLDSLKVMLETQSQRIYQVERTVYQGDRRW
jgi:hypothetical protein